MMKYKAFNIFILKPLPKAIKCAWDIFIDGIAMVSKAMLF